MGSILISKLIGLEYTKNTLQKYKNIKDKNENLENK